MGRFIWGKRERKIDMSVSRLNNENICTHLALYTVHCTLYTTGFVFWVVVHCNLNILERRVESVLSQPGPVLGLLQLLLSLAELGQVESSDLLGLLDLLLVGLDLLLELAGQVRHTVLVLPVLVVLELQFLDLALGLLVGLHVVPGAGLDIAQLDLQL